MPNLSINGVDIHYREAGEGYPVVLVHGFTGNMRNWALTVPALVQRYRAVSLDLRGHGLSGKPTRPQDYTPELMADDIRGLLQRLGIQICYLVGHSMGGMIAQTFLLRYPEIVRALALVDTSAEIPAQLRSAERARLAEIARDQGMEAVFEEQLRLTPANQRLPAAFIDTWRRLFLMTSVEAYIYCGEMMRDRRPLLDDLATVSVPTIVICGEKDEPFVEPSKRLHAAIPGSRLVFIADTGHTPQIDKPQEFNQALLGFLAEVDARVAVAEPRT